MKITKIEQQKRKADRFSIYVDDEFLMGVGEEILLKYMLFKGKTLTEQEIEEIESAENNHKVYIRALNYLSYGMRSEHDMREYLNKHKSDFKLKKAPEEVIEATIQRLIEQGYLDDRLYAESYVRTASNLNLKGPIVIKNDLKRKGINSDIILKAMDEYPESHQSENIDKLADKYMRTKTKMTPRMLEQRLYTHLVQKGYPQELIRDRLKKLDFIDAVDDQDELLDKEGRKLLHRYKRKHSGYALKQKMSSALYGKGFDFDRVSAWVESNKEEFEDEE